MRSVFLTAAVLLSVPGLHAEVYKQQVTISNEWNIDKTDEPFVISLKDIPAPFPIRSAILFDGSTEIPCQLDDLDRDGQADELVFVADLPALSSRVLHLTFSSQEEKRIYPSRVFAEMLLRADKGEHQIIHSLSIPGHSSVYNLLHHHGPAFESELVAYRIYFDKKQTVDIYGKFNKGLEIEESQFYPTNEQLARGFGDDVLRVSGSCGLGTLKGWNGEKALHIEPVESRTESVLATGPVRTVVDVDVNGWQYQESLLSMKIRYILYAGHRDCQVQVQFDRPLGKEVFSSGVMNIQGSTSFSDQKGLIACWGTDWPVNDTLTYAKETVGLAVCIPPQIVKEEVHDKVNYLYTLAAEGRSSFTYYITFTSRKETFGYADEKEWFAYVQQWKNELQQPARLLIKK
ncbi:DUF4861 domain-containing protein [Parabacteroides sp. 52]|uniref:DUF4861 domain-containing protein n=1 Tax=unclassified Parabacteroides TaxID=2649774 RepID=UPI0013D63740|nr:MULTISPECIES: DUF4861 domain-containing protein [unclassified Parabacteroides]NDV54939.1 DUF4861 domain-containing protein [Parabacteroides sp. 52]